MTGVQTCALPILAGKARQARPLGLGVNGTLHGRTVIRREVSSGSGMVPRGNGLGDALLAIVGGVAEDANLLGLRRVIQPSAAHIVGGAKDASDRWFHGRQGHGMTKRQPIDHDAKQPGHEAYADG